MATAKVTPLSSHPQSSTITAQQIVRYAEITSLISDLESQKDALRAELLSLHAVGAEQEAESPYLLNFVHTERRAIDWKAQSLALAEKLFGIEKLATWKAKIERSAPVQAITQVRVTPNPTFAAGLKKLAATAFSQMKTSAAIQ